MGEETLKDVLLKHGIKENAAQAVIEALEKECGKYRESSRIAIVRTQARRWEMHTVVRSRLGESDGGPEWFTIGSIKT